MPINRDYDVQKTGLDGGFPVRFPFSRVWVTLDGGFPFIHFMNHECADL